MTKDEIFAIWAPDNSPWSRWVKPVVFAHLHLATPPVAVVETTGAMGWSPPSTGGMALVLDLPGAEGVVTGLALAGRGYGAMFQRVLSSIGFRRASGGGFGAWLPETSAGG